jgi:hypothetical protein
LKFFNKDYGELVRVIKKSDETFKQSQRDIKRNFLYHKVITGFFLVRWLKLLRNEVFALSAG